MAYIFFKYSTLLLCLAVTVYSLRKPTISYITQEQIRDIGGQVDLDCSVNNGEESIVLWMKYRNTMELLPLSTDSNLIVRDSRFSVRFDVASATYTLSIKDIEEMDAGWYQCLVIVTVLNRITADVELKVRRPPIISDNSTRSLVASERESVSLECYADGFPTPKILWRRENNVTLPTGGMIYRGNILKIASLNKEDRGTYYCVAENGVGRGVRRNISLEVEFAPVVTVPRSRILKDLKDTFISCQVTANPPAAITWFKDGNQLLSDHSYKISTFSTTDYFTTSTVRMMKIKKQDYGIYTCKAQNKLGTDKGRVKFLETATSMCPSCDQAKSGEETSR